MAQSAFIVCVPEAEPLVSALRERFDPSAKQGVPAHITILYPFMSPHLVSEQVLADVRRTVSQVASFKFLLSKVGRFPATTYLAPNPAGPFEELTRRLVERFPAYLPYAGEQERVIPHLTVAHGNPQQASAAEAQLSAALAGRDGISSTCNEIVLLENSSGTWKTMHAFGLSPQKERS